MHGVIMPKLYQYPTPVIMRIPGEVTYPVSCTYNGGIIIDNEWYDGYSVPAPIVPKGYKLTGLGVGLQLNARPPLATALLEKV